MTLSSSPGARALDAFARDSAADSAIDSVVYDLAAYDPDVPAARRFIGISRDGIHGYWSDPDVASMALVNRRAYAGRVAALEAEGLTTSDAQSVVDADPFGPCPNCGSTAGVCPACVTYGAHGGDCDHGPAVTA